MGMKEFGEGHKGAGGAPVPPAEPTVVASEGTTGALTPEEMKSRLSAQASTPTRTPYIPGQKVEQDVVLDKPAERPSITEKGTGKVLNVRYPEDFEASTAGQNAKNLWKLKGNAVIGETHDLNGNPIADTFVQKMSAPVTVGASSEKPSRKSREATVLSNRPAPQSEYEAQLIARRTAAGSTRPSRTQASIYKSASENLRLLEDHWNKVHTLLGGNDETGEKDLDINHPVFAAHVRIGGNLAAARMSLINSKNAALQNNTEEAIRHLTDATHMIHAANSADGGMHSSEYYTSAGSLPPVGTAGTDKDRAHMVVEYPTAKTAGALIPSVKLGRYGSVENTQANFEKVENLRRKLRANDPSVSGVNRQLFNRVYRMLKKGTAVGGAEFSRELGTGTNVAGQDAINPAALKTEGVVNISEANKGGARGDISKGEPQQFVYVHPDAMPGNAVAFFNKETGKTSFHVDGGPPIKRPSTPPIAVPYGQHLFKKVVDREGMEIPHLKDDGTPLSFEELKDAGALTQTVTPVAAAPSAAQAPKPKAEAKPEPRSWDVLTKEQREAAAQKAADRKAETDKQLSDIDAQISQLPSVLNKAYEWKLSQKKTRTKGPRKTGRKNMTDAELIAEALTQGVTRSEGK